eukprot:GEMP01036092.1.p1 GENE.GEMP01036092.1~~GEMP01036092.1.p1  ORF type:complete len:490 (+),score=126.41 GEMP01036092.1:141-1610(+)
MEPVTKKHKSCLSAYIKWLEDAGVKFNGIVLGHDVARGYGIYQSAESLEVGQVVCRIPRKAALTYDYPDGATLPALDIPYDDSQLPIVLRILIESKSSNSPLQPKLDVLNGPEAGCAFQWPLEIIRGTELESVCAMKHERMKEEMEMSDLQGVSYEEYAAHCGRVISHATPFFPPHNGQQRCPHSSLTGVVDMGNLKSAGADTADLDVVEAKNDEVHLIVLNASTKRGDELYIAYGEPCLSVAESLYRYGFALEDDHVHAAVSLPSSLFPQKCIPLLRTLGLLTPSQWDGMDDAIALPLLLSDTTGTVDVAPHDSLNEGIAMLMVASYVVINHKQGHPPLISHEDAKHDECLSPYEACARIVYSAHPENLVEPANLEEVVNAAKAEAHAEDSDADEESESEEDGELWSVMLHHAGPGAHKIMQSNAVQEEMLAMLQARKATLDARKSMTCHPTLEKYAAMLHAAELRTLAVAQEMVESLRETAHDHHHH